METSADEQTRKQIAQLWNWIEKTPAERMAFFGGAGVSTESGIPDFRSADGLYRQKYGSTPPEEMISRSYFDAHPQEFFDFYFDRMIAPDAWPNRAHISLAELEERDILDSVVTQNIDGLHQAAGSTRVHELHGSVRRNYCMKCGRSYSLPGMLRLHEAAQDGIPRCESCGATVKPDVVLYEEPLDESVMAAALDSISRADLLLVAGTSLVVYPAAGFVNCFKGDHLIIVNRDPTPRDALADLRIRANIGDVLQPR